MDTHLWRAIVTGQEQGTCASLLRAILAPASFCYGAAVGARNTAYRAGVLRSRRIRCPVISVGNIVAGGTGKTPLAQLIAGELTAKGKKVAILSRGYGAAPKKPFPLVVSDGAGCLLSASEAGDETVMLAKNLSGVIVIADPVRHRGGDLASGQFHADVCILDDGFQHRRLFRDLDILCLDCARPFGNGKLLPAGELRERPAGISRADIIIATGCADSEPPPHITGLIKRFNARAALFTASRAPVALLNLASGARTRPEEMRGKKVGLLSGIAKPRDFERLAAGMGAVIVSRKAFPDHHFFTADEVKESLAAARKAGAEAVLTTSKDAVRLPLPSRPSPPMLAVEIEMSIGGGNDKLIEYAFRALASCAAPRRGSPNADKA